MPKGKHNRVVLPVQSILCRQQWVLLMSAFFIHLIGFEAWNRKYQGGRTEGHPIQTHDFQCCTRTFYFIYSKVGVEHLLGSPPLNAAFLSHKEVMDMEVDFFLENFTGKDPELLKDHAQKMSSGEAPYFPTTLGLLYAKLAGKVFARPIASGSGLKKPTDAGGGGPVLAAKARVESQLRCPIASCGTVSKLERLYLGVYCPGWHSLQFMHCPKCNTECSTPSDFCPNATCNVRFL